MSEKRNDKTLNSGGKLYYIINNGAVYMTINLCNLCNYFSYLLYWLTDHLSMYAIYSQAKYQFLQKLVFFLSLHC